MSLTSSFSQVRYWLQPSHLGFIIVHLACLAAIYTGVSMWSIGLCVGLYYLRMFGVTGGYHRYFSHRTYKMGRVMQFLMAFLAQSSAQRGCLWWAAHHRHHHRHSDDEQDLHSPMQGGLWHAHVGWIFDPKNEDTDLTKIADLARFPELRFLDRFHHLPAVVVGAACFAFGGLEGLVVGFCWSTVMLWHGTFTINSLSHVFGKRVYDTTDDSRNSFLLALVTMGEGWHNNHHHYQSSTRQGFRWYEIDLTWYILTVMSWFRLVRDLRGVPERVLAQRGVFAEEAETKEAA